MKVYELDKKINIASDFDNKDIIWLDIKNAPFQISGVFYDECQKQYVRMPQDVANSVKSEVRYLNRQTAGGRVRFKTNSKFIAIHAVMTDGEATHVNVSHSCFDLQRKNPNFDYLKEYTFCNSFAPPSYLNCSFSSSFLCPEGYLEDYAIHFPTQNSVYELYIALDKDADIFEPTPYLHKLPIVYYGSSITQGAGSSRPANTYQAIISKHLDTDYINLGFAGNAKGEQEIARYIASLQMSIFVCDYDHNAPNAEHLYKTHLPFYRTVRNANPDLPIIFITAPNTMPWYTWYQSRRDAIYNTYETAIKEGDKNVYFIDGDTLFGDIDKDLCTVDTCHPTDLGIYRMAMQIEKVMSPLLNKK